MLPETMPIKDLLRVLRSGMTAGRRAFEPLRRDAPPPVQDVVRGLDLVSSRIDSATSRLAHSLFDSPAIPAPGGGWTLGTLANHPKGEVIFAQLAYVALAEAFKRFANRPALISETLACQAFTRALHLTRSDPDALPAEVVIQLVAYGVIRPTPFDAVLFDPVLLDSGPLEPSAAARQAATAFVLMLCTAHDASVEDHDLLDMCCDAVPLTLRQCDPSPNDRPALRAALAASARLI